MKIINSLIMAVMLTGVASTSFAFEALDVFGTPASNSVMVLPAGTHVFDPDVVDFMFVGLTYESVMLSTFVNSFGDRTYFLAAKRNWIDNEKYDVGYAFGLIYGYDGRLAEVGDIPFKDTFLFNGPVSPLLGLTSNYHVTENFSVNLTLQPLVVLYGFEVKF
jgi:hypothetical protein